MSRDAILPKFRSSNLLKVSEGTSSLVTNLSLYGTIATPSELSGRIEHK